LSSATSRTRRDCQVSRSISPSSGRIDHCGEPGEATPSPSCPSEPEALHWGRSRPPRTEACGGRLSRSVSNRVVPVGTITPSCPRGPVGLPVVLPPLTRGSPAAPVLMAAVSQQWECRSHQVASAGRRGCVPASVMEEKSGTLWPVAIEGTSRPLPLVAREELSNPEHCANARWEEHRSAELTCWSRERETASHCCSSKWRRKNHSDHSEEVRGEPMESRITGRRTCRSTAGKRVGAGKTGPEKRWDSRRVSRRECSATSLCGEDRGIHGSSTRLHTEQTTKLGGKEDRLICHLIRKATQRRAFGENTPC